MKCQVISRKQLILIGIKIQFLVWLYGITQCLRIGLRTWCYGITIRIFMPMNEIYINMAKSGYPTSFNAFSAS